MNNWRQILAWQEHAIGHWELQTGFPLVGPLKPVVGDYNPPYTGVDVTHPWIEAIDNICNRVKRDSASDGDETRNYAWTRARFTTKELADRALQLICNYYYQQRPDYREALMINPGKAVRVSKPYIAVYPYYTS